MNDILVISAENKISVVGTFLALKESALEKSALVGLVKSAETQESAIIALREVKQARSVLEKGRKSFKQPFLDRCTEIDATAKSHDAELKDEELRLNTEIGNFQAEELARAREAERARQREIERIEREQREAEYQARKQAEEAERKRQEEAAAAKAESERAAAAAAKAIEDAENAKGEKAKEAAKAEAKRLAELAELAAAKEREESERRERESRAAAAELERQNKLAADRAAQDLEAVGGQAMPVVATGQSSKPVFDYEVTDIWALTRSNPGFVKPEPIRSAILAAINEHGVKEIKGLRIIEIIKTRVNTRDKRAIDI